MGLTRQYLRYAAKSSFGLISSAKGGLVSLGDKNLVASATAENVTIWNLKTGNKVIKILNALEVRKFVTEEWLAVSLSCVHCKSHNLPYLEGGFGII